MSLGRTEQPQIKSSQSIKNSGNIIIQNWNTRKIIPKELEEYVNLPIIADKAKLKINPNAKFLPPIIQPPDKNYYAREQ